MTLCILGRQPLLGLAELEQLFGSSAVRPIEGGFAQVDAEVDLDRLGGSVKTAKHLTTIQGPNPQKAFDYCRRELPKHLQYLPEGKLKLGVSLYGFEARDMPVAKVNANVLSLKKAVKSAGKSVRVVPNTELALSSAQTYHNKLTAELGMELVFIKDGGNILLGQVLQVQDISAYAARDQARPKTDAFVGMLPPKLAQIMLNLALPNSVEPLGIKSPETFTARVSPAAYARETRHEAVSEDSDGDKATKTKLTILDPFCGTGVVLQEASLLGYNAYGTDLSEKMVDYSLKNLEWAKEKFALKNNVEIHHGDAMDTQWQQPIDAVASETYLGQPFSAPPSPAKLEEVRGNCNHIIGTFLRNIASQLQPGAPLCLAVPAWRGTDGHFTHLPLIQKLSSYGFSEKKLTHVRPSELLYYREEQVVARQLLVLERISD